MDQSKILILGGNGQLGKALQKRYPDAVSTDSSELDITSIASLASYDWSGVEIILNAAAYTNVDGAETPDGRRSAWAVNAVAPANIAEIADEHGITLVHISTDYVFDGTSEVHTEDEQVTPLSSYGSSKAAGDLAVSLTHKHYIVRTSWLIGEGRNFVKTMVNLAQKNISPTVVQDQVGRLTFTNTIVEAIDHLLNSGANYGTYNVSNSGNSASWADITRSIFKALNRSDLTVSDISTAEYFADKDEIAPRPLQSTLDLAKIEATGFTPIDWEQALKDYIQEQTS